MLIYRFKIVNDDNDNFYREIEIKPGNTFEDFHKLLVDCIKLSPGEIASFYICDSKWNKLQEISLCNMEEPEEDESETLSETDKKKVVMMSDVKLKECINDPNQRMIYIYDFFKMYTFYIELSKITEGSEKTIYPRCTKSVSEIHKPRKASPKAEEINESEEEVIDESEDFFNDDTIDFDEGELPLGDGFEENKII